jgi:hypothetical protein
MKTLQTLTFALTSDDMKNAIVSRRIAGLLGVEG